MLEKGESHCFSSTLVLMAALNEEKGIELTIADLKKHLAGSSILVVDGKSTDKTVHVAKNLGADILFQNGRGKGDAVEFALRHIDDKFEYVVMIDADYTYSAKEIPQMIKILCENPEVGMVCGNRFNSHFHSERMNDLFYIGNRLLALVHNLLNGVAMRDPLSGLRVIRTNLVANWTPKSKGFDIEVEINHHIENKGYLIYEIDVPYRQRVGEKKLKARHGVQIFRRILTEMKQ